MSQVSLKEEAIKELKAENEKVKAELTKISENRQQILHDRNQLQKKLDELKEKCIGKGPLQGAKHIIWDTLTIEITKFRHYLCFIDDLSGLTEMSHQILKLVDEHMARRPLTTAQNSINFLNSHNTPKAARHGHQGQDLNSAVGEEDHPQAPFNEYCPRQVRRIDFAGK